MKLFNHFRHDKVMFRDKLFLVFLLIPLFFLMVFLAVLYKQQKGFLYNESKRAFYQNMYALSESCLPWVISQDVAGLNKIISSYRDSDEINYLMITDRIGKILAHTDRRYVGRYLNDKISLDILDQQPTCLTINNNKYELTVAMPVTFDHDVVGWIWCQKNMTVIFPVLNRLVFHGILFSLIGLLAGLFFAYLLSRIFTRGLTQFLHGVKDITAGRRNVRLDASRPDELGLMAQGFNQMLDTIDRNKQDMQVKDVLFRSVFENTATGYALTDVHNKFMLVNQSFLSMLGYTLDELIEFDLMDITHEDDRDFCKGVIMSLFLNEKKQVRFEKRYIHKNGYEVWCEMNSTVIRNAGSSPMCLSSVSNITAQKDYEKNLKNMNEELEQKIQARTEDLRRNSRFLNLAQTVGKIGSWNINLHTRKMIWSDETYNILGIEKTMDMDLDRFISVIHPEDKEMVLEVWDRAMENKPFNFEHRLLVKGRVKWVHEKSEMVFNDFGECTDALGIVQDITELKLSEFQVNEVMEELRRSNKELDDFGYIASHDLKEPLRSISNFSSFILEDYQDKLDAEGVRKLNVLIDQSARLESFLSALLRYSRVGRVKIQVEKINLQSVIEMVKQDLNFLMTSTEAQIVVEKELPVILSDPVFIKEIYLNLISNAVKYNDKPERMVFVGYLASYADSTHVFYVRDNGIGIEERNIQYIFKIFKRLHSRDKFGGGTGAGLTIVKKLVEALHGRIWVESVPGQGSTFYFTLGGAL